MSKIILHFFLFLILFNNFFGLLDRCSFRTLFELEGTSKPQLSFSLAQRKELKETSTLTKPSPIWEGCN
jgi:hypothetical protein